MSVATFEQAASTRGTDRLLVWMDFYGKDQAGSDLTYVWSGHTIPSSAAYQTGPAEGRVLSFGHYDRGLSSFLGELKVGSMTVQLSDHDRTLRGFLGRTTQLGVINIEVAVRAIPESQWRVGDTPVTLFRGVVRQYRPSPDYGFDLELSDWLGVRSAQPFPLQPLTTSDFPTLPESAAGGYAPLVLGPIPSVDGTSGRVPVTYVGEFVALDASTWSGFLVAYGAVTISHVYQDSVEVDSGSYGITWAIPGQTGFSTLFGATPYYTENARRYTLIYVLGPDGSRHISGAAPITVATSGYDTLNTLGGTTITSIYDHLPWLLKNFIMPDVAHPDVGGNWLAVPTWEDTTPRIDTASFTATAAEAATEIPSGPTRGWIISSPDAIADVLGHALVLGDCAFGVSQLGQAMIVLHPPIPDSVTITDTVDYVHDILDGFRSEDDPQPLANKIGALYGYDPVAGTYSNRLQLSDPASKAWYRVWIPGPDLDLYGVDDPDVAEEIAIRALIRMRKPARTVVIPRALPGLADDLGDRQLLTHPEGPTATGYVNRRIGISQVGMNLDEDAVEHLAHDLDWIRAVAETITITVVDQGVWRAVTTGGGRPSSSVVIGGGGGGSWTMGAPPVIFLGGSMTEFVQSPTPDWVPASASRSSVNTVTRASTTGTASVRIRAATAGVSVTPRLWDVTNAVAIGTGDPITSTAWTPVSFVVDFTPGTSDVEIQLLPGTANEDVILGHGEVR